MAHRIDEIEDVVAELEISLVRRSRVRESAVLLALKLKASLIRVLEGVMPCFDGAVPSLVTLIEYIWRAGYLRVIVLRLLWDINFSGIVVVRRSMHILVVGAYALDCLSRTHSVFKGISFKKEFGHHRLYLVMVKMAS